MIHPFFYESVVETTCFAPPLFLLTVYARGLNCKVVLIKLLVTMFGCNDWIISYWGYLSF